MISINFDIDNHLSVPHIDGHRYSNGGHPMSEIHLAHFTFGGQSVTESRFYEVALREARVATEMNTSAVETTPRPAIAARAAFATRLRLAFAGGAAAATDSCSCPA
jgi:hypothetical protein